MEVPKPRTDSYHYAHIRTEGSYEFTLYNELNSNKPMRLKVWAMRDANFLRSILQTNGYKELNNS